MAARQLQIGIYSTQLPYYTGSLSVPLSEKRSGFFSVVQPLAQRGDFIWGQSLDGGFDLGEGAHCE